MAGNPRNRMDTLSGCIRRWGLAALLLFGCTPPPAPRMDEARASVHQLFTVPQSERTRAWGEASVSADGETYECSIEVRAVADSFAADFYGPLGIRFGTIRASTSSGRGSLRFRDDTDQFDLSQPVSIPPFGSNESLTYGELLQVLLGRVPSEYEDLADKPADSIISNHGAITLLWKTDSMKFHVIVENHPVAIAGVDALFTDYGTGGARLGMSSFKDGRARKIEIRQGDGNYFSITYSRVKRY